MKAQKITYFLFIFFIIITIQAQTKQDYCEQWRAELITMTSSLEKIKFSKKMQAKVDSLCLVDIEFELAGIHDNKENLDSTLYYLDRAIKIGKELPIKSDSFWAAYGNKASIFIYNDREKEALNLLKELKNGIKSEPDNQAWHHYYGSYKLLYEKKGDYTKALKYIDSMIVFSEKIQDTLTIPTNYNEKAILYFNLSNYSEATKSLLYAIELREKQENPVSLEKNYYNLGYYYTVWEKYNLAKSYAKKSISRSKKIESDNMLIMGYTLLGRCHRKLNQSKEALKSIDSALVIAQKPKSNKAYHSTVLREKGWVYLENLKQYTRAEESFIKAYEIDKDLNIDTGVYGSLRGLVTTYLNMESYQKAKEYLRAFEAVTNEINISHYKRDFYNTYGEYYEKTNQSSKALDYFKKYYKIKDSISDQKVQTQIANLEKQYDTKKKELEIANLSQEKEEQKQITQEVQARQNLYLVATILLLLLLLIGIWAFRKLKKQQKELASTNQVKNRLFSIIAHDLRGMIIPFQRSGKILKHHIDKGNHQRTIELSQELEKNSENLSNTLDNLLNWSLEQMNGYKVNPEQISVAKQLKEIVDGFAQQAAFKNTNIEVKYEEDIFVLFDKGAFHVIFRNLIGNALKYTEDGNIRIQFKKDFNTLVCSVNDTGIGMSEDQLQHVFSFEEKQTTIGTQGEKGSGLGLNLVYRFVNMNQGTIKVSSEMRIGTSFDLSFPIKELSSVKDREVFESKSA